MDFDFGDLYGYSATNGVVNVIPQTSDIKTKIENAFKQIFGSSFSTNETTANGRLIEALTMFFVDVCGVNAQNANSLNIDRAIGVFLDNLGAAFGVARLTGESDNEYRKRIILSYSRGSGFASSIRNAIAAKLNVKKVVVLDNGSEDPAVLPLDSAGNITPHSITVAPHSVMISVLDGSNADIADAIRSTKSAGCGYTTIGEYGTVTSETIVRDGTSFTAKFYRPAQRYVKIDVVVSSASYTGVDISADTISAIKALISANSINSTITVPMITAALASNGKNIVGISATLTISDTDPTVTTGTQVVEQIIVPAYKYLNDDNAIINVTIQ